MLVMAVYAAVADGQSLRSSVSFANRLPRTLALSTSSGRWTGDVEAAYQAMRSALNGRQIHIEDMYWEKDEKKLLVLSCALSGSLRLQEERERCATKSRPVKKSFKQPGHVNVAATWPREMLSENDQKNLREAWERLDKEISRAVIYCGTHGGPSSQRSSTLACGSATAGREFWEAHIAEQDRFEGYMYMCPERTAPTFTTVDQLWSRLHERWLTALEKLAIMGFPVTQDVAKEYQQDRAPTVQLTFETVHAEFI